MLREFCLHKSSFGKQYNSDISLPGIVLHPIVLYSVLNHLSGVGPSSTQLTEIYCNLRVIKPLSVASTFYRCIIENTVFLDFDSTLFVCLERV